MRVRLAKPPSVMVKTYCGLTSPVPAAVATSSLPCASSTAPSVGAATSSLGVSASSPAATSAATWAARMIDIDSSSSPARNFMPVTPDVARPIGRSWQSSALKRIDWPLRETSRMSSSALASSAPISSSSSSRKLIAMTPAWRGRVVVAEAGLLDQAVAGREHEVGRLLVVADREHLGDLLVGLERQQPGHVAALGVTRGLGQVVGLGAVDPAGRGEEQQPVVVGRWR